MTRMIDVFAGLFLVFTTFSLVASAITEAIETVLRKRATDLEAALGRLLGSPAEVQKLYDHPLIKSLQTKDGRRPSYIPSETFAIAVLDVFGKVRSATTDTAAALQTLPDNPACNALRSLGAHAERNLAAWKSRVEGWYDAAMDRVSAIYKRRTQWWLLALGLLIASALNVDAINIAQTLAADPALRARTVELAGETVARTPSAVGGAPAVEPASGAPSQPQGTPPAAPVTAASARESFQKLQALGLPIGWAPDAAPGDPRAIPSGGWDILKKIIGILATAFAITMGAPFWFDNLNRVMQLRASVKPAGLAPKSPGGAAKGHS